MIIEIINRAVVIHGSMEDFQLGVRLEYKHSGECMFHIEEQRIESKLNYFYFILLFRLFNESFL